MSREYTLPERKIFEISAFLLTSARGLFDEPPNYGPLRLIQALHMLLDVLQTEKDPFLDRFKQEVKKYVYYPIQVGVERMKQSIDELIMELVSEVEKRKKNF